MFFNRPFAHHQFDYNIIFEIISVEKSIGMIPNLIEVK